MMVEMKRLVFWSKNRMASGMIVEDHSTVEMHRQSNTISQAS